MFGVRSASQETRQRVSQKDPGRACALQSDLQCELALPWLCISSTKLLSFEIEGNKRLWGAGILGTQLLGIPAYQMKSCVDPKTRKAERSEKQVTETAHRAQSVI